MLRKIILNKSDGVNNWYSNSKNFISCLLLSD